MFHCLLTARSRLKSSIAGENISAPIVCNLPNGSSASGNGRSYVGKRAQLPACISSQSARHRVVYLISLLPLDTDPQSPCSAPVRACSEPPAVRRPTIPATRCSKRVSFFLCKWFVRFPITNFYRRLRATSPYTCRWQIALPRSMSDSDTLDTTFLRNCAFGTPHCPRHKPRNTTSNVSYNSYSIKSSAPATQTPNTALVRSQM